MPSRALKVLLAAVGVVLAGLALAAVSWLFVGSSCGNDVLREIGSPDGQHRAVVFQRDCGATTDFSTQVSILPAGTQLRNEGGNLFVATGAPAGLGGGPIVEVSWIRPRLLQVRHHRETRVVRAESKACGVVAHYATLPPPGA
jgi:hypothetical protein